MSKNQSKRKKPSRTPAPEPPKKRGSGWLKVATTVITLGATLTVIVVMSSQSQTSSQLATSPGSTAPLVFAIKASETKEAKEINDLYQLLALDPEKFGDMDIARMNLLCAQGLPGAEGLDIEKELAVLDTWAASVKAETDRSLHRFYDDPANFENSLGYFKILVLITVLQRDNGVHYNPERIFDPDFSDCRDVFINGLTQASTGKHAGGTCVSMPVVYIAVARRLGYPVKMVTTFSHVFARWEDENERFNIEATNKGLNVYEDEHYLTWPETLTDLEIESGSYMRSLTPVEELAAFVAARGYVLDELGQLPEAALMFTQAHVLDPVSVDYFNNMLWVAQREFPDYPVVAERKRNGEDRTPPKP